MTDKEDIDKLEELLKQFEVYGDLDAFEDIRPYMKAIKNVISRNKELEKEIKRMKSLDIYKLVEDVETGQLIPTSKIKEKIEELNKKEKEEIKGLKGQDRYFVKQTYNSARNSLEELLEVKANDR